MASKKVEHVKMPSCLSLSDLRCYLLPSQTLKKVEYSKMPYFSLLAMRCRRLSRLSRTLKKVEHEMMQHSLMARASQTVHVKIGDSLRFECSSFPAEILGDSSPLSGVCSYRTSKFAVEHEMMRHSLMAIASQVEHERKQLSLMARASQAEHVKIGDSFRFEYCSSIPAEILGDSSPLSGVCSYPNSKFAVEHAKMRHFLMDGVSLAEYVKIGDSFQFEDYFPFSAEILRDSSPLSGVCYPNSKFASSDDWYRNSIFSDNREAFDLPKMQRCKSPVSNMNIGMGKDKGKQKENEQKRENTKPKDDAECSRARDDDAECSRARDDDAECSRARDDIDRDEERDDQTGDYSRAKTLEAGRMRRRISEVVPPESVLISERVPPAFISVSPILVSVSVFPPHSRIETSILISVPPTLVSVPDLPPYSRKEASVLISVPPILVSVSVLPTHSRKETLREIMSYAGVFLLGVNSVYVVACIISCVKKLINSGCPTLVTNTTSIEVAVHHPSVPDFNLPKFLLEVLMKNLPKLLEVLLMKKLIS